MMTCARERSRHLPCDLRLFCVFARRKKNGERKQNNLNLEYREYLLGAHMNGCEKHEHQVSVVGFHGITVFEHKTNCVNCDSKSSKMPNCQTVGDSAWSIYLFFRFISRHYLCATKTTIKLQNNVWVGTLMRRKNAIFARRPQCVLLNKCRFNSLKVHISLDILCLFNGAWGTKNACEFDESHVWQFHAEYSKWAIQSWDSQTVTDCVISRSTCEW